MSSSSSSGLKPTRAAFTPSKRPLSVAGESSSRIARSTTPSALGTTTKKFKSALSTESKVRITSKLSPIPGTPARRTPEPPRSKTPSSPRKGGTDSPAFGFHHEISEWDVANVDVEEALVTGDNVDFDTSLGDVSVDVDESWLASQNKQDKVMVSVRIRPTTGHTAWDTSAPKTIKLQPQYAKTTGAPPPEFNFDAVLKDERSRDVYTTVARNHVCAAMDGFNSLIFAYGQTASGKTYTLTGDQDEPGIIPRSMKDVFTFIRRTPGREYLLRCSYLEIYNETVHDLLAPSGTQVQIQGTGSTVILTPLREEVVTSLKSVKEVLERGEGNRRTASTDWNERSSRSHSVFRLVIESRERGDGTRDTDAPPSGRQTPGATPGGPRLQSKGGRTVQTSVLSLIDLAGSEKATSDKDRTREGKYINTSLLTLGTVIGTLADNASKGKTAHIPFRNSKLTRMLQPSLQGNAVVSVICTISPDTNAVSESTSTLLFAQRIKKVQLNAQKREVVDTDALIERYRKEIEDLKARLAERETEAPVRSRRLSAREQIDESKAMRDLNTRIHQLTKLILTSQTVDETHGDSDSRPASPVKAIDFDMSPYQLQQDLLNARRQLESQSTQILSLEAALLARPLLPADTPEADKDRYIADQARTIRELQMVRGYGDSESNKAQQLRAEIEEQVRADIVKEWEEKLQEEIAARKEKEEWAAELVLQLEREKKIRKKLAAFVSKFDGLISTTVPSKLRPPMPSSGGSSAAFAERQQSRNATEKKQSSLASVVDVLDSPVRIEIDKQPGVSLLEDEEWSKMAMDSMEDVSFELPATRAFGLQSQKDDIFL